MASGVIKAEDFSNIVEVTGDNQNRAAYLKIGKIVVAAILQKDNIGVYPLPKISSSIIDGEMIYGNGLVLRDSTAGNSYLAECFNWGDGIQCKCYGFPVGNSMRGTMVYITDD